MDGYHSKLEQKRGLVNRKIGQLHVYRIKLERKNDEKCKKKHKRYVKPGEKL